MRATSAAPARERGTPAAPAPVRVGLRLMIVGLVTVLVQITTVSQIPVFGTTADLLPLVTVSAGLLTGSVTGALTGFGLGLFADLALVQTLGVSSLLLVPIGYAAGRLRELRDPHHALVPLAAGALATFAFACGLGLIELSLGVDAPITVGVLRQIFGVTVLGAILALPVHAILRRVLAGTLPEGGRRRRRRRAYATGGLSPLSSSGSR